MFSDATVLGKKTEYGKRFFIYTEKIIPDRVVKKKAAYEITHLSPFLIIEGFTVVVDANGLVEKVFLFGLHPNCDLKSNLFCLSKDQKNSEFNEEFYERLMQNIRVYYLDDCYYKPTGGHLQYKKMKSIYMELNEGD